MNDKSLSILLFSILIIFVGCKKDEEEEEEELTETTTEVPEVYKKVYSASDIYIEGDYVVIKVQGIPDHKSPYYQGTQWENSLYQEYNGSNSEYNQNPNKIAAQNYTYKIPLNPKEDANHEATPMGSIGVALNGVAFFNQYAAPGDDLEEEKKTFDQYYGHPQNQGVYHYHLEPIYLTATKGSDALLGFLLDGFPVYGPVENGNAVSNDDLDVYHGHTHATDDYPNGTYHYHITDQDPYINGDGYYGTPGTVTN